MNASTPVSLFPKAAVAAVVGLGLALRLVAIFFQGEIDPAKATIWEYGTIAEFAVENGYLGHEAKTPDGTLHAHPTGFMPPLPIFLWMGLFKMFGVTSTALSAFLALNWILSGIVIYQGARLAWYMFRNPAVSVLSAALLACYPTFAASVATYHAIQIYMVLFLGGALLALRPAPANWKTAVGLGALGGLAALARTEYVVLMAPFFLMLFLRRGKLGLLVLSVAVAAAIVLPWTARNYLVFGRFIPVANSTGFNLFKGFNELANGSGDWVDNNSVRENLLGDKLAALPLDENYESARDDIMKEHALAYMEANPVEAFVLLPLKKQLLFWTFDYHDPMAWHPAYQAAFWPVFLLTLAGLWTAWRNGAVTGRTWIFLLALFAAQAFVMSFYAVHLRYRMNVEPFLFPFAAYAVWLVWTSFRQRNRPAVVVGPA
jgi:hypothetical protein